ncbi:MmcQ/YjbR family DNA-binding protein [Ochrobactrum sp. RH2CCR150]|uniref:MmcQ/YjbR family DNA-binding protein n=1 Tax=Ochrobactrum sp. RH2CCR150 TaxID=2587044 RepID=UPI0015FC8A14|nr:putative DNA-binding protein (MmcQ/YjbR family) [Ochrobactrum sp. RH2CCR150]
MTSRSEIFEYAEKKYNTKPDYPFAKFPHYAVLRHGSDDRWYGLVMDVPKEKLGLDGEGSIDVIDIKCHPEKVHDFKARPGFLPAYHMNKEHWLTVLLNGTVSKKEVLELIDESYALTV